MPTNSCPHVFSRIYRMFYRRCCCIPYSLLSLLPLFCARIASKKSPHEPCFSGRRQRCEKKVCGVSPREQNATQGEEVCLGRRCLRNFAEAKKKPLGAAGMVVTLMSCLEGSSMEMWWKVCEDPSLAPIRKKGRMCGLPIW